MGQGNAERRLVIAIDGPAASGKSTTARDVADRLGYTYIDTGAMYRAATLAVLRSGIDPHDQPAVEAVAEGLEIRLERGPDGALCTMLGSEDVSEDIRRSEVTRQVSLVSSYPGVRRHLVELQQRMGERGGVVLDGRDIGTVVFPHADVKVFMVADISSRAERRCAELQGRGETVDIDGLKADIERRDRFDTERRNSPLLKADDAVEIDTSCLSIPEQVDRVLALARERLESAR